MAKQHIAGTAPPDEMEPTISMQEKTITTFWYRGEEFDNLKQARDAYIAYHIELLLPDAPHSTLQTILEFFREHSEHVHAVLKALD